MGDLIVVLIAIVLLGLLTKYAFKALFYIVLVAIVLYVISRLASFI